MRLAKSSIRRANAEVAGSLAGSDGENHGFRPRFNQPRGRLTDLVEELIVRSSSFVKLARTYNLHRRYLIEREISR